MKYAIYQSKVGLYACEYADTQKAIKPYPYIKNEYLPVIINNNGGYSRFDKEYEKKNGFLKIITIADDAEPLTREQRYPKNSAQFEYGWIDTEGNTYNTGFEGHYRAAEAITEELGLRNYSPEDTLERLGWVKITAHWLNGVLQKDVMMGPPYFITKKQADILFDQGLWENRNAKCFIESSEEKW